MKQLIYSAEDDVSLGELIKYALTEAGYEARLFTTAESMIEAMVERPPSLILLDVMLPGMDGIDALEFIRNRYKNVNVKIILLTAKNGEIDKIFGLNGGADDYITKPFSVLELIARVKAHLRRYATDVSGDALVFRGLKLFPGSRSVTVDGQPTELTYKEFELLKMLLENVGTVLDRAKLIKEIWGFEYFGESRTVDIHIKNLRAKLGGYANCIVNARGVGYVLKNLSEQ
ncbi:MAG: response regulator transcription factor [Clostridiales bacterium]|jgi:two-component system alkaline phosphatase synthesis response regulator PhoP|nr:response regulator transcription factor [Clostridiales bacterium]